MSARQKVQGGYTAPAGDGTRPTLPMTGSGVAIRKSSPSLGQTVLVTTGEKISGQNEHAAIVTKILSDNVVNVMLMPGEGQPYPIPAVHRAGHSAGSLFWRPRDQD